MYIIQAALVALGYDCGSYGDNRDGIDGDFGYTTQAAGCQRTRRKIPAIASIPKKQSTSEHDFRTGFTSFLSPRRSLP